MSGSIWDVFPQLTDEQIIAGAWPGESWEEARSRLESNQCTAGQTEADGSESTAGGDSQQTQYKVPNLSRITDQYDQMLAFQNLSPRAKFDHWLEASGRTRPDPDEVLSCPSLSDLVAVGMDWTHCLARMPDEDTLGRLYYLVWGPESADWLTLCRARNGWMVDSDGSLMTGVSIWRIARGHERFSRNTSPAERRLLKRLNDRHMATPDRNL